MAYTSGVEAAHRAEEGAVDRNPKLMAYTSFELAVLHILKCLRFDA